MIFVWGSRLFGKTDSVPGVFHVATKCGHCQYLPLIPMGSFLVFAESGKGWKGVPIPFSFKSYAMAWLRIATIALTVIFGLILMVALLEQRRKNTEMIIIGAAGFVAALAAHIGSYYIPGLGRATPAKMEALALCAGLDMDAINQIRQVMMKTAPTGAFPVVAPPTEASADAAPTMSEATPANSSDVGETAQLTARPTAS